MGVLLRSSLLFRQPSQALGSISFLSVLGSRILRSTQGTRRQLLIQWEGLPELEATWEDEGDFV